MGVAASEIVVNTLPECCCDNPNGADESQIHNEEKQQLQAHKDEEMKDEFESDEFLEDAQNEQTEQAIANINVNMLRYEDGDLWTILDRIFESYQQQHIIDAVQDIRHGIKTDLDTVLDEYSKEALYAAAVSHVTHRKEYKFSITKMSINDHSTNKHVYETQSLWFYDDKSYGLASNKHESDTVCPYKCVDGSITNENRAMDCDNSARHQNYRRSYSNRQVDDKCLLQLQYLSCGNLASSTTSYCQTRTNYERNQWCFEHQSQQRLDDDDECTQIAFLSFGQQYTSSYYLQSDAAQHATRDAKKIKFLSQVAFINDVSFLKKYSVRKGYQKYGATAYFNKQRQVVAIQTYWDNKIWLKSIASQNGGKYMEEWKFAKWIWKVSLIVASHLCEWIAKCRFIEINSFIIAVQKNIDVNHVIRRLCKPFMFGAVSANNHFLELLKQWGLYHRVFGFEYQSLCALLNDSMKEYSFKILRKKFKRLSKLSDLNCPAYHDIAAFWQLVYDFVSKYFFIYYGRQPDDDKDDVNIIKDKQLRAFYAEMVKLLHIEKKYRYKRFNVIMLITHYICTVSVYNKHLNEPISFDGIFKAKLFYPKQSYSIQNYAGCAGRTAEQLHVTYENDVLSFTEYVLVILNNGMKERTFNLQKWIGLIPNDSNRADNDNCRKETARLFKQCQQELEKLEKQIEAKNKYRKIPYTACCVSQLQISACL